MRWRMRLPNGRNWEAPTLSDPPPISVHRGEIWLIALDPTVGAEIQKTRPYVVMSSNAIGKLPVKLIVPFTDWKEHYSRQPWLVEVHPTHMNGLGKVSGADTLQVRGVSLQRFRTKLGLLEAGALEDVALSIALVVEAG